MNVQAMAGLAPAFNIRWDASRAAYFVDKPNIGDTAVYTAEQVAALQQQLAAAREALQAAEANAARYRYLCSPVMAASNMKQWTYAYEAIGSAYTQEYINKVVDAAIDATLQRDRQP